MDKYWRVFILVAILAVASAHLATSARLTDDVKMSRKHRKWMARHGKVYKSEVEKKARFEIFKDNLKFINDFNKNGNQTYKMGLNHFADLTFEEFQHTYLSKFPEPSSYPDYSSQMPFKYENVNVADLPPSMDWRAKGAVTPAKQQGTCGTCWAFSTAASIEGINYIKTGQLTSLSEQQMADCIGHWYPCTGDYPQNAFTYVAQNGGLASESDYPYIEEYGPQWEGCYAAAPSAQITGYENVPQYDEVALQKAVAHQPVSVLFKADQMKMMYYSGGIMTSSTCGEELNHAITMVGYGTDESGNKYWLAKNSWGATWGDNGFLKIQRDSGITNICGITESSSYPVI